MSDTQSMHWGVGVVWVEYGGSAGRVAESGGGWEESGREWWGMIAVNISLPFSSIRPHLLRHLHCPLRRSLLRRSLLRHQLLRVVQ